MKDKPRELFSASLKSRKVFIEAQKHSRRVRFFKLLLPAAAIVLAVLFSWFTFFSTRESTNIIALNGEEERDNRLVMTAPKIEGYTSDNKLYAVTAARAIQDPQRPGIIELEYIKAVLPFGDRGQAVVNAEGGVFDNINGRLQFSRPFTVQTSDGMIARLLSADVNIETGQLKTTDKVEISNKTEFLTANGMRILDNGRVIMFDGSVRLVINHLMEQ